MAGILPSGAYLIRNKHTDTVIEVAGDSDKVSAAHENPNGRREQQIWWVETLPGHEHESEEGAAYSITNIPRGKVLDTDGCGKFGLQLVLLQPNGYAWQKWWIKRVQDDTFGEFYNIINVHNDGAVDIGENKSDAGAPCHTSKIAHQCHKQRWEFVTPPVAIPPGWVQIRSVSPGQPFLQHTYVTSPPFVAPAMPISSSLQNIRENWGAQWTFMLGDLTENSAQCYWSIKNRLTGGHLLHMVERWRKNGPQTNVNAAKTGRQSGYANMMWRLDIHRDGYWTLLNKGSSSTLTREPSSDADTQVTLNNKDSPVGNDHNKWEILEMYKMAYESKREKPPCRMKPRATAQYNRQTNRCFGELFE